MGGGRGPPRHGTLTWLATLQSKGEFNSLKEQSSQITLQQNVPFKEHKHQIHNIDIALASTSMAKSRRLSTLKAGHQQQLLSSLRPLREAKSVAAKVRTILIHKARLIRIGFLALHLLSFFYTISAKVTGKIETRILAVCVPSPACSVLRKTGCRFLKATRDAQCQDT